jgi:hypothetical protein
MFGKFVPFTRTSSAKTRTSEACEVKSLERGILYNVRELDEWLMDR